MLGNSKIGSGGWGHQQPTGGLVSQIVWLGPEIGSQLTLFCIHHMNCGNFHMALPWCQHRKHSPIIIIVFVVVIIK